MIPTTTSDQPLTQLHSHAQARNRITTTSYSHYYREVSTTQAFYSFTPDHEPQTQSFPKPPLKPSQMLKYIETLNLEKPSTLWIPEPKHSTLNPRTYSP